MQQETAGRGGRRGFRRQWSARLFGADGFPAGALEVLHVVVRKAAHVVLYAALGALALIALLPREETAPPEVEEREVDGAVPLLTQRAVRLRARGRWLGTLGSSQHRKEQPMCSPIRCRACGRYTWAGCGQHVDRALAGVPVSQRCTCRR